METGEDGNEGEKAERKRPEPKRTHRSEKAKAERERPEPKPPPITEKEVRESFEPAHRPRPPHLPPEPMDSSFPRFNETETFNVTETSNFGNEEPGEWLPASPSERDTHRHHHEANAYAQRSSSDGRPSAYPPPLPDAPLWSFESLRPLASPPWLLANAPQPFTRTALPGPPPGNGCDTPVIPRYIVIDTRITTHYGVPDTSWFKRPPNNDGKPRKRKKPAKDVLSCTYPPPRQLQAQSQTQFADDDSVISALSSIS